MGSGSTKVMRQSEWVKVRAKADTVTMIEQRVTQIQRSPPLLCLCGSGLGCLSCHLCTAVRGPSVSATYIDVRPFVTCFPGIWKRSNSGVNQNQNSVTVWERRWWKQQPSLIQFSAISQ